MKPPYGKKPGGSGRPPSNRGPGQGGGGSSSRFTPGSGRPPARSGGGGAQRFDASADRPASSRARPAGGDGPAQRLSLNAGAPQEQRRPRPQGSGFGGKPPQDRFDGPRREARPDKPPFDKPRTGKPSFDKPRLDKPRLDKPRLDKTRTERPRLEGPRSDDPPRPVPRQERTRQPDEPRSGPDTPKGTVWLYGHHAVAAALANPRRRLRRLILTAEAEATLAQMLAPPWPLQPERTDRARIDQLLGKDIAHQGAALLADPLAQPGLAEVLERSGPIVVLDQVTDPRNVGAIMRSAAAFGAAAVITQDRNAPEETGSLAKAASGTLESIPLLRAVNIARTLIALKAANVWCVGLDAAGEPLSGGFYEGRRVALVLGAEGTGLRRLTRETCDAIAGLSIKGAIESLNVSAAGAVALYELTRAS